MMGSARVARAAGARGRVEADTTAVVARKTVRAARMGMELTGMGIPTTEASDVERARAGRTRAVGRLGWMARGEARDVGWSGSALGLS